MPEKTPPNPYNNIAQTGEPPDTKPEPLETATFSVPVVIVMSVTVNCSADSARKHAIRQVDQDVFEMMEHALSNCYRSKFVEVSGVIEPEVERID